MNFLEKNLVYIKNTNLFEQPLNTANYRIVRDEIGGYVCNIQKNDGWKPIDYVDVRIQEHMLAIKPDINSRNRLFILIGFGLGNYIEEVVRHVGNNKIIIIECDPEILKYSFLVKDLSHILTNKNINIEFCDNNTDINSLLDKYSRDIFFAEAVDVIVCPGYNEVFNNFTSSIIDSVKKMNDKMLINKNTLDLISEEIVKNFFENIPYIIKSTCVNNLKDVFMGKTAVVVSSGPSLEKNMHILKDYKDKVIILTTSRNLRYMINEGIIPHMVCILDSGDIVYDFTKDFFDLNLNYVCSEHANSKTVRNITKSVSVCPVLFNNIVSEITNTKYDIFPSVTSVAHLCTLMAVYMGCKNVLFIGQDLAYTDNKYHAEFENDNAGNSIDNSRGLFYVEGNKEKAVLTDAAFMNFKIWLEEYIAVNKGINFINCTDGGAKIKGADIGELDKVLDRLCDKDITPSNRIKDITSRKQYCDIDKSIGKLMKIKEDVSKAKCAYEDGISLCDELYDVSMQAMYDNNRVSDILRKLAQIDQLSDKNNILNGLINIITLTSLNKIMNNPDLKENDNDDERQKYIKLSQRNKAVCNLYMEATDKISAYLSGAIDEVVKLQAKR